MRRNVSLVMLNECEPPRLRIGPAPLWRCSIVPFHTAVKRNIKDLPKTPSLLWTGQAGSTKRWIASSHPSARKRTLLYYAWLWEMYAPASIKHITQRERLLKSRGSISWLFSLYYTITLSLPLSVSFSVSQSISLSRSLASSHIWFFLFYFSFLFYYLSSTNFSPTC